MDLVTRFCPSCGVKVKASAQVLASPQKCPGCKQVNLFWDITKEPLPEITEAIKYKPAITPTHGIALLIAVTIYVVIVLLLMLTGFVGIAVVLSFISLAFAVVAIVLLVSQQYQAKAVRDALRDQTLNIEVARSTQIEISKKYHLLQSNFVGLVANAKAAFEKHQFKIDNERVQEKQLLADELRKLEANANQLQLDYRSRFTSLDFEYRKLEQRVRKELDLGLQGTSIAVQSMAVKLLSETESFLIAKLTTNNFAQSRDRYVKMVVFCNKAGAFITPDSVKEFESTLRTEFESLVRKQAAKEEQAKIKERIREEQKVEAEIERELKRAETERRILEEKLADAIAKAHGEVNEQIEDLKRRLAEAESKQRSISMAQQTKSGFVYVISNIGSFGTEVFKIGMTRRLEPMDRVHELGDASVPFPFDVHMMISCENAPALENGLHKHFSHMRVNKVNFRKEYFRVSLDEIVEVVRELHGEVEYVATPEALQYRESQVMSDEEFELIEVAVGDLVDEPDE